MTNSATYLMPSSPVKYDQWCIRTRLYMLTMGKCMDASPFRSIWLTQTR